MTKAQITEALAETNPNYRVCDYDYDEIGQDNIGLPIFKTTYTDAPINYRLIRALETPRVAILEDLDYIAPVEEIADETTP